MTDTPRFLTVLPSDQLQPTESADDLALVGTLPDGAVRRTTHGALKEDVLTAAPDEITLTQPGTGAVPRKLRDKLDQIVYVEDFGAVGNGTTDDAAAINLAIYAVWLAGGGIVRLRAKRYCCRATIAVLSDVHLIGEGVGLWLPASSAKKTYGGTTLLFRGTGTRDKTAFGVTDMRRSGGVVANASGVYPGFDDEYSLTSFTNNDANATTGAAATLRQFSVALMRPFAAQGGGLKGLRIQLAYDGSTPDGLSGYNEALLGLGDSWDVGLYLDFSGWGHYEDIQVVGYWRIAGGLVRSCSNNELLPNGGSGVENNVITGSVFTGQVGLSIRGSDVWRVTAVGTNWIEVPWADNHPFDPATMKNIVRTDNKSLGFTFTGTQKNGDFLRLTGVTTNPVTAGLVAGDRLRASAFTNGCSGFTVRDCKVAGLDHASGNRSSAPALATRSRPSAAIEISGAALRGPTFPNTKVLGRDDVLVHLHDCHTVTFDPSSFESFSSTDGGSGAARFIASNAPSRNTRVAYPAGETYRLNINALQFGCDLRPRYPQGSSRFSGAGETGLFDPSTNKVAREMWSDEIHRGTLLSPPIGGRVGFTDSDGVLKVTYDDDTGGTFINGDTEVEVKVNGDVRAAFNTADAYIAGAFVYIQNEDRTANIARFGETDIRVTVPIRPSADGGEDLGTETGQWANIRFLAQLIQGGEQRFDSNGVLRVGQFDLSASLPPALDGRFSYARDLAGGEGPIAAVDGVWRPVGVRERVVEFLANGSFTPLPGETSFRVQAFGPGGPGAGGAKTAPGAPSSGGAAGGAGLIVERTLTLADIGTGLTVTIGNRGLGGEGATLSGTAGANGTRGTATTVVRTSDSATLLAAHAGGAGAGGQPGANSGGGANAAPFGSGNNGAGSTAGSAGTGGVAGGSGTAGSNASIPSTGGSGAGGLNGGTGPNGGGGVEGPGGGGAGGGISAANSGFDGGNGGRTQTTTGPTGATAGAAGTNGTAGVAAPGTGGSGGAGNPAADGGRGGDGGFPGGGGGGGGSSQGGNGGRGGDGGAGFVRIIAR
jgi:hypothetical protein